MTAVAHSKPQPRWYADGPLGSLVGATGAIGVAGAVVITSTSLFLSEAVHAGPLAIGLFFAGRAVAEIVTDLVVGVLSDRVGSRRVLLALCSVFSAAGAASYAVLRDYYLLLFAGAFFFGIGGATFSQLFAYTREFAEARGHGVAFFNSALRAVTSAAWIVGPPLGFFLIEARGFGVLYAVAAALYAVAGLLCRWGLPGTARLAADEPASRGGAFSGVTVQAGLLMAAVVLLLTVNQMYQIDIALLVTEDLGYSAGFVGLMLGLASALEIPAMIGFGAVADRVGHWRLVVFAAGCAVVFFCLLPLAQSTVFLLLLQVPNAAWMAIVLSIPVVILQDALPDRPGVASALYSGAFKAGAFLGGAVAGVAASGLGFTNVFWVCGALALLATALLVAGRTGAGARSGRTT